MNNLHEDVQRWLIQENYSFNEAKTEEENFKIIIKNVDAFGNNLEIFEPKQAGQYPGNWYKSSSKK